jgi:hypothetical protein
MAHFRTPLGLPTSANSNKYVALQGEITGGGGNYVSIAESFYAEVLVPNVCSATDISTAFASAVTTQLDSSTISDPGVTLGSNFAGRAPCSPIGVPRHGDRA